MKLFVADIHIKLGQKNVPKQWSIDRVNMLASELIKQKPDTFIIGGDLLDVPTPSNEELGLCFKFLKQLGDVAPVILINGNHELESKTKCIYRHYRELLQEYCNTTLIDDFASMDGIDYIPYSVIHKKLPKTSNKIAVTHVRGEIPPHVVPEIDLSVFSHYDIVLAGDLHSHETSQLNILYPGSPYTTSFHRNRVSGINGYIIFDPTNPSSAKWVELDLPQLIRKTVSDPSEIVPTEYDHTVYELTGDIKDLAKVDSSSLELLDKKIANNASTEATLALGDNVVQNLVEYLAKIKGMPKDHVEQVVDTFKRYYND